MRNLLLVFSSLLLMVGLHAAEYPRMGEDIYDPRADGQAQITAALIQARAEGKNVLLMFGANWCIWCHRLHHTFGTNEEVAAQLNRDFVVVMVDANTRNGTKRNAAVNDQYGNPIQYGLPVLVVLDASGKLLVTQETGALEDGAGHSPAKIMASLREWAPKS